MGEEQVHRAGGNNEHTENWTPHVKNQKLVVKGEPTNTTQRKLRTLYLQIIGIDMELNQHLIKKVIQVVLPRLFVLFRLCFAYHINSFLIF